MIRRPPGPNDAELIPEQAWRAARQQQLAAVGTPDAGRAVLAGGEEAGPTSVSNDACTTADLDASTRPRSCLPVPRVMEPDFPVGAGG